MSSVFQMSLVGSGSGQSGDLVTWNNLFAGGIKHQQAASSATNDTGIITMEDEDEDDLSDQEMAGPADSSSTLGALFTSFTSPTSPTGPGNASNANATSTTVLLEGSKPFEVLRDLLCHHAHLAVFMNYVISNSDPSALVICFH